MALTVNNRPNTQSISVGGPPRLPIYLQGGTGVQQAAPMSLQGGSSPQRAGGFPQPQIQIQGSGRPGPSLPMPLFRGNLQPAMNVQPSIGIPLPNDGSPQGSSQQMQGSNWQLQGGSVGRTYGSPMTNIGGIGVPRLNPHELDTRTGPTPLPGSWLHTGTGTVAIDAPRQPYDPYLGAANFRALKMRQPSFPVMFPIANTPRAATYADGE